MITQEEIPFTEEEYKAMVKTIAQLRKEKKELLDKVCEWLDKHMCNKSNGIKVKDYQLVCELIYNLRKAMGDKI